MQRHGVLVAIVLLAVIALLTALAGVTKGIIIAHRQRDRAEESFAQSREAIDHLFTHAVDDRLLNQPGFDSLRIALFEDTGRFYRNYLDLHRAESTLNPELIEARSRVAKVASLIGPKAEAVSQYRQAIALWEQVVLEQPTNRHYQEKLAATLGDLGLVLMPMKDQLDEAGHTFRRASKLIEPLITADPQSISLRQELGRILLNLAQIRSRQNHLNEALEFLERVEEIQSQLVAENPRVLEPRILLAAAYAAAGRILAAQPSELHRAMASHQEASELYQTIVQERPELADQAHQFARNLSELCNLQQRAGQLDLAFQTLRRSLGTLERLYQLHPKVFLYERDLGSVYNMMAGLECKRAESANSLALAQKGRMVFERLVSEHPVDLDLRVDLAESYTNIGRQFEQTGQSHEALQSFQRAIDLYEGLPKLEPQTAYKLACTISRCIPLIGAKNRTTDSGRAAQEISKGDRLRQRVYGDRAIAALRRAIQTSRFTAETLETERDLDALHERSDFREVIKEVEKKQVDAGN